MGNEISKETLLNEVRKLSVAFIIDHDLNIWRVKATEAEDVGQAGYAISSDLSKAIRWTKVGENYILQDFDINKYLNFYLHYELARKGTTLKNKLSELCEGQ
ncbi:MAG: hypothetical protein QXI11_02755 [Thermoproteota archaeon]